MRLRLISWNTANRRSRAREQAVALLGRDPDVVALQEVTESTEALLSERLAEGGLPHTAVALRGAGSKARALYVLIASRFPLQTTAPLNLPWHEKSVSALVSIAGLPVEVHAVHIPPGSTNKWVKIECLEAVYRGLAQPAPRARILCGDFNTPQMELEDATVLTWAQRRGHHGETVTCKRRHGGSGERWDAGERNVLLDLARFDLVDVYRMLHGYGRGGYSWLLRQGGRQVPRRFDHVFASRSLRAVACEYLHEFRLAGLSDHAPVEAEFRPSVDLYGLDGGSA